MFVQTNKLIDILPYFKKKLIPLYEEQEVENIFYLICEEKYGLAKFQTRNTDKRLSEAELLDFRSIVKRLEKSEPIQHILGAVQFYDCRIQINGHTLIPRPETEELVEWILEDCFQEARILDIGTGSGCIPIALKKSFASLDVSAVDISTGALKMAESSAKLNEVNITFIEMDILNPNKKVFGKYDIIVSNPPYVLESDKSAMADNVLEYEPHLALFVADSTPLLFYRQIAEISREILSENGFLFFEIHENYGTAVCDILKHLGYQNIALRKDMQGKDRMIKASFIAG